jgi:hypothetical protein
VRLKRGRVSHTYSLRVGRILHLQVGIISLPNFRSTHDIAPSSFLRGDIHEYVYPQNTNKDFLEVFLEGELLVQNN